jgi:DNA-binding NarL/FixJ family response regulator
VVKTPPARILVGVHDPEDPASSFEDRDPESVVITLLDPLDIDSIQASLQAGATGSIDLNASADDVFLTLHAAMSQHTVLPTLLARRMVRDTSIVLRPGGVGDDEVSWLRALASGETVAALGRRLGYSEREMYRRLRRLYSRMGARGRTEALLRAAKWGLLD